MKPDRSPVRYTKWFALDVLRFPMSLFATVAILMGVLFWRLGARFGRPRLPQGGEGVPQVDGASVIAHTVQVGTWSVCLTVAVLMATTTVIGNDLLRGYYRTWFSKPMAAWWYYLQRYLLAIACVMIAPFLLGLALSLTVHGGLGANGDLFATMAESCLLVGSGVVLLTLFNSRGWLLVYLMDIAQNILGGLIRQFGQRNTELPDWVIWLHKLLPPFDKIDVSKPALQGGDLMHVLIYGGGMLVLAMVLLRYRPLGSGGKA